MLQPKKSAVYLIFTPNINFNFNILYCQNILKDQQKNIKFFVCFRDEFGVIHIYEIFYVSQCVRIAKILEVKQVHLDFISLFLL